LQVKNRLAKRRARREEEEGERRPGTYADVIADGVDFLAGPLAEPVAPHLVEHLIHAPSPLSPFLNSLPLRFGADGSLESNRGEKIGERDGTAEGAASLLRSCARRRSRGYCRCFFGAWTPPSLVAAGSRAHGVTHTHARSCLSLSPSLPPVLRKLGVRMAKDRERQTDTGPGGPRAGTEGFRLVRAPGPALVSCLFPLFSHEVEAFFFLLFFSISI